MQRGIALFGRGDAEGALREYERAEALAPAANLPYRYAAEAWISLGRTREAIASLEAYLRKRPDVSDADAVKKRIEELEKSLPGTLVLRSDAPRALARIDGNDPRALPLELDLPPGPHVLVVESEGYRKSERVVRVPGHERLELTVALERAAPLAPPVREPHESERTAWPTVGLVTLAIGATAFTTAAIVDATALGASYRELERASQAGSSDLVDVRNQTRDLRTGLLVTYGVGVAGVLVGTGILLFAPSRSQTRSAWIHMASGRFVF
jgi:tetratricopeptide (TPR) repeat protein